MVKITTSRALKIGVQSRFYPISTVGFSTFSSENLGLAYAAPVQIDPKQKILCWVLAQIMLKNNSQGQTFMN